MTAITRVPRIRWTALNTRVIAVAKEGGNRDWAAYIGPVPGNNHGVEYVEVLRDGSKLPEEVAKVLFPSFSDLAWRE